MLYVILLIVVGVISQAILWTTDSIALAMVPFILPLLWGLFCVIYAWRSERRALRQ